MSRYNNLLFLIKEDFLINKLFCGKEKLVFLNIIIKFFISRHARILVLFRMSCLDNTIISKLSRWYLKNRFNIEVAQDLKIGKGLLLPHPVGMVIGDNIILGDYVTIGQYVSLGGNFKKCKEINGIIRKTPIIGNNIWIGAGSVIAGPVCIGDNVIIGANSVITKDIESKCIVTGYNKIIKRGIVVNNDGSFQ